MNSKLYIHAIKGPDNVLFNAIGDPATGSYCYPDILIKHNFTEKEIQDAHLYELAANAIKEYGSSRCFFITYKNDEVFIQFLDNLNRIFTPDENSIDMDLITEFGEKLLLSTTMMNSLKTLLNYYSVSGNDMESLIKQCTIEYELPVPTKIKGKQIYELIRTKIIG